MRDVLVAGIIASAGRIDGRVKLQKIVYLVQRMGFDFEFYDFALRDYGPFSPQLASTVDSLTGTFVVEQKSDEIGVGGGDRAVRYSYTVSGAAREQLLRDALRARFGDGARPLEELCRELVAKERPVLEVAATLLFIRDELGLRGERLWQEARQRKGHLEKHFDEARRLVSELDARVSPAGAAA